MHDLVQHQRFSAVVADNSDRIRTTLLSIVFAVLVAPVVAASDEPVSFAALETEYRQQVFPLLKRFCLECHSSEANEGDVDLERFGQFTDVRRDTRVWQKVARMLGDGEMPPEDSPQLSPKLQQQLHAWVKRYLDAESRASAGDPGPVVLRRLSNAEYTYTIRDLTGVDTLDPAAEFPVDGAAGEGFTNAGSAQGMSPVLAEKYLDAAKQVASHVVLLPDGIRFSPYSTRRDQTDAALASIRAFYRQFTEDGVTEIGGGFAADLQNIKIETNQGGLLPLEKYLAATLGQRDALLRGQKTVDEVARERSLNARYLATLWKALAGDSNDAPSLLLDPVREKWRQAKESDAAALASQIGAVQKVLWKFNPIGHIGREGGPKSWLEAVSPNTTGLLHGDSGEDSRVQLQVLTEKQEPLAVSPAAAVLDSAGGDAQRRLEASMKEFRELFPPVLCYTRIVPVDEVVTLTLFYREDDHLKRLMLSDRQAAELERLWDELYFITQEPLQQVVALEQISEFATQDRPDLVKAFAPMRGAVNDRADAFRERLEKTEPAHVRAVLEFADRAWRRPLAGDEQLGLRDLYRRLRDDELPHEEAIRLMLARVLASPALLYKLEQPAPGIDAAPVTDLELATRLSYFLWSSLPDQQLRAAAATGRLADDEMLVAQTHRMVRDPRTRRLAIQFACQWLHLRDFDKNDDKNEKLYPEFAARRHDMYEETVRFFVDMFRGDGSILGLLDADHTFLNETLAKHYGIDGVSGNQWQRVDGIRGNGRGGILGMGAFLASQSGASRTSPILRGNWVYETLLGERLPRPPADVPQLPDSVPQGLTARQLIERHSSVEACAKCHEKIDPYGFALEQYDAMGRLRPQKVATKTTLAGGETIEGIDGLRDHLADDCRDDVVRQFCRKLLGYALGREVQLSDEPLLDKMTSELAENDFRFLVAVEATVTSPQFREIRGRGIDQ